MSSTSRLVWFQLLDSANGQPFKETSATKVSLAFSADIDDFRDAVKAKYDQPNYLKDIPSGALLVYQNMAAFNNRNSGQGNGNELKPSRILGSLGESEDDALIVTFPSAPEGGRQNQTIFKKFLEQYNINRPDDRVLSIICKRYSQQLQSALSMGSASACFDIYLCAKEAPKTFTRGIIQDQLHIILNGPVSLAQPNILIGVDVQARRHILVKLLRIPETTGSQSISDRRESVEAEIEACITLTEASIEGLVKCEVVRVTVEHADQLNISAGLWSAIKMQRYVSSLTELPQLPIDWLWNGFLRIKFALEEMHKLNMVHMDVKADNVFVDSDLNWDLGDFGSTRKNGARIWSWTEALTPYILTSSAIVIPSMDFVHLCVMIAVELGKESWKTELCASHRHVQEHLILDRLSKITIPEFKNQIIRLFSEHLATVKSHLSSST